MKPTPTSGPTRHYETRHLPVAFFHRLHALSKVWKTSIEDVVNIVLESGLRVVERTREGRPGHK